MVDRIVSDRERVVACKSFWRSRFDTEASIDTIARITGLDRERIRSALELPIAPAAPIRSAVATATKTETLLCQFCDKLWTRPVTRGRKPPLCPDCR